MRTTVNTALAGLAFWAGLFATYAHAPSASGDGAEVLDHSFDQRWHRRVSTYCKVDGVVFPRCTVDTPLQELLNSDDRRRRLKPPRWPNADGSPRRAVVDIWIRDDGKN